MQRLALVLIMLGLVAGLLVGGQRLALEEDFRAVELSVDLDDLMALVDGANIGEALDILEKLGWDIDSLVITVSPWERRAPDELRELASAIKDAGYPVILRVGGDEEEFSGHDQRPSSGLGQPGNPPGVEELAALVSLVDPQVVMFGGSQVAGYPSEVGTVARLLRASDIRFGLQEFAHQLGEKELAHLAPMHMVRVHTIYPREMSRYDVESARARLLRAVRERSYRLLYLRLWPGDLSTNTELVTGLETSLRETGYAKGPAASLPPWQMGLGWFGMAVCGWLGAGLMLYHVFPGLAQSLKGRWALGCLVLVAFVLLVLYLLYDQLLARQALAFLVAITFPTLAVIPKDWTKIRRPADGDQFCGKNGKPLSIPQAGWSAISYSLYHFGRVVGITTIGAAVMVAALGDFRFMLKIAEFRGVKAMFVVPLLLVGIGAILHSFSLGKPLRVRHRWRRMSPWARIIVIVGGLLVIVVYVGRTGNFIIPVPTLEMRLRELLEKFFPFRPRTKEFLIGHPLLILGFGLYGWEWQRAGLVGIVLGTIGQISILNTFTHIHSPLLASISRSVWGLLLGSGLGFCLLYLVLQLIGNQAESRPLDDNGRGRAIPNPPVRE